MDVSGWIALGLGVAGFVLGGISAVISLMAYRVSKRATVASESSAVSSQQSAGASITSAKAAQEATSLQRQAWNAQQSADVVLNHRHAGGSLRYRANVQQAVSFFETSLSNRGQHPALDVTLTLRTRDKWGELAQFIVPEPVTEATWQVVLLRVPVNHPFFRDIPNHLVLVVAYTDGITEHELEWTFDASGDWPDLHLKVQPNSFDHTVWGNDAEGWPIPHSLVQS